MTSLTEWQKRLRETQRKKTQNYTKPEVVVLGEAVRVIEQRTHKGTALIEVVTRRKDLNPAYDLDE